MEKFCKLFESEKYGQILVTKDNDDDFKPSVFVKFQPKGLGLCGPTYSFTDKDEDIAWEKVDKLFDSFDIKKAESIAAEVCEMLDI